MKKYIGIISSIVILSFLCGCIAIIVGTGLATGTIIAADTVEFLKEAEFAYVWQMSKETLKRMGEIKNIEEEKNTLIADVKGATVWCVIERVAPSVVRIQVKARKNLMPNIDIASQVLNSINHVL